MGGDLVTGHPSRLREWDPCSTLLCAHGSPCTAPISPQGGLAPALSPARVRGRVYPVRSHTGASLAASSPRRTPESSSCAASAHPHTHTVPGPCSTGSHARIILGAVPRLSPSPASLLPMAPFHHPAAHWGGSTRGLRTGGPFATVPFHNLLAPGMCLQCPSPLPRAQPHMGHPQHPLGPLGPCQRDRHMPTAAGSNSILPRPGSRQVAVMLG